MKLCRDVWLPDDELHMVPEIEATGGFNADRLELAWPHVKKWRVAVDVGAHAGTWTRKMAERFMRVLAFESSAENFQCLDRNLHQWKLSNVEAYCQACGAVAGHGRSMSGTNPENTGGRWIQLGHGGAVRIVTIDSFNLSQLDLLKVDAEGMDVQVLKGAKATIERCRPVVVWEDKPNLLRFHGIHEWRGPAWLLSKLGMRQVAQVKRDKIWAFS